MRARSVLPLAIVASISLAACAEEPGHSVPATGVRGVVLAGPQCPVEQVGSPCPDEPITGVEVRAVRGGSVAGSDRTDAEGRFEIALSPGAYLVQAVLPSGGPPSAGPVPITVPSDGFVQVTVPVDTGIR